MEEPLSVKANLLPEAKKELKVSKCHLLSFALNKIYETHPF